MDLVCGTCHEPIIDGQGRFHPTHRLGKNSPHFHVACGETDPRDARIAELEAALTVFSAHAEQDATGTDHDFAHPEDGALINAVVNAHALGVRISEHHALVLLSMIGMDGDAADELLAAAREEASQP